jgi:hypothetical protein
MLATRRRKQKNRKVLARNAKREKKVEKQTAEAGTTETSRRDVDAEQKAGS